MLHGISFALQPGTISTLLGANGAGKSSTVMALAGAIPTASGTVSLGSLETDRLAPDAVRRRGIAMVPEGHRVLGQMSVEDNLLVSVLSAAPMPAATGWPAPSPSSRNFGSPPPDGRRSFRRPGEMVAMAQAFLARPRFMIVDELSLGLAPTVVKRLAEALTLAAGTASACSS